MIYATGTVLVIAAIMIVAMAILGVLITVCSVCEWCQRMKRKISASWASRLRGLSRNDPVRGVDKT